MSELTARVVTEADAGIIEAYRGEFPKDRMRVTLDPKRIPGLDYLEHYRNAQDWLDFCAGMKGKIGWYLTFRVSDGKLIGAFCLRFRLEYDDDDPEFASHIGYSIRPSERGKGYGKEQLRLALLEAKKLGLPSLRIVCRDLNEASNRAIRANGGVFLDTIHGEESGMNVNRYEIRI